MRAGRCWAYCQRHKEVIEQKQSKVLPSCYESTKYDGKNTDNDVQGILFPVIDKRMNGWMDGWMEKEGEGEEKTRIIILKLKIDIGHSFIAKIWWTWLYTEKAL